MIDLSIPGQMTEGELRGIEGLARKVPKGGSIVEVGSLFGLSSYTWATTVDPSVTVHCIDPWVREQWIVDLVEAKIAGCPEFSIDAFKRYTRTCTNLTAHQGYSPREFGDWSGRVDLFFDDALHHNPYFRESIRFWLNKMKAGGIMCGHDYCDEWPDVKAEVNLLAGELGVLVHTRQWLWWIEIPNNSTSDQLQR